MSYGAALRDNLLQPTGARASGTASEPGQTRNVWQTLWSEVFRTQAIRTLTDTSTPMTISFAIEALPMAEMLVSSTTTTMLSVIEKLFGDSASDMARMLRVSRPMIYHYREGMEPSVENKRRLQTLANLASDWGAVQSQPLRKALKEQQPEGRTLLEYLSDEELDVVALRRMLFRRISRADQTLRNNLANALASGESAEARGDITRARHAAGKPVYVGDPEAPGKLIQVCPDGTRVRGRMIKRQFVPDEE